MSRLVKYFTIDALSGDATEAAILLPGAGSDTDYIAERNLLVESVESVTSELRTAGTLNVFTRKNGTQAAAAVNTLDSDKTFADQADLDPNNTEQQLSRGDRFGIAVTTSSWTPLTADLHVRVEFSDLN